MARFNLFIGVLFAAGLFAGCPDQCNQLDACCEAVLELRLEVCEQRSKDGNLTDAQCRNGRESILATVEEPPQACK